jgi:shikimate dehydrogenase
MAGEPYAEVIGDPIEHSKSPLIHKYWLDQVGLPGGYRAVRVAPTELDDYLAERRRDARWRGCNITAPLKRVAVAHADWLHSLADADAPLEAGAGAINLIVKGGRGRLAGFNTDVVGVTETVQRLPWPKDAERCLSYIIGAGGAARAAVVGLSRTRYGNWFFFNRSVEKAEALSTEFRGHPRDGFGLDALNDPTDRAQPILIVNATPMGMAGQPPVPIDLDLVPRTSTVFDMVYAPPETPLVSAAREVGLQVIDGLDLLIAQAAPAFELLFGVAAPRRHDAELRGLLTS